MDIESEIEKLRLKKVELTNKLNIEYDFDEKEEIRKEVQSIQQQIDTLERYKKRF